MASWRKKVQYRVAGLPNALRRHRQQPDQPLAVLRRAYRHFYWHPRSPREWSTVAAALVVWPFVLLQYAVKAVRSNGSRIAERTGKSKRTQFAEMIGYYFRSSILPHWYYIFSLHDPGGRERARGFLNRFETKVGLYDMLNAIGRSPLTNKAAFARHCLAHGLPTVPLLATVSNGEIHWSDAGEDALRDIDLFIKPVAARGGKGAERWDSIGPGQFRGPEGEACAAADLVERLRLKSRGSPVLVQPRLVSHPDVADLSNGALCTVRALTCLDEHDRPELVAAVYRMAIGANVTVDNIHAGGIAAAVDLETGRLSQASDLGRRPQSVGWLARHPQTAAQIEGRLLPMWEQVKALAVRAHLAFADRVVLGWDIAILKDGPILVEGNARPDVDLMQRPLRRGLGEGRTAELLAHQLRRRMGDI